MSDWDGWSGDEPPDEDAGGMFADDGAGVDGFGADPHGWGVDGPRPGDGWAGFGAGDGPDAGFGGGFDGEPEPDWYGAGRQGDPTASLWYGDEPLDDPRDGGFGSDADGQGVAGFGPADPVNGGDAAADGFTAGADPYADGYDGVTGQDVDGYPDVAGAAPVGADPDLGWEDPELDGLLWGFPVPVWLDGLPDPVDGYPWADAGLLGAVTGAVLPDPLDVVAGAPQVAELFAYTGETPLPGADDWAALLASADPATSTLARFWSPR